MVYVDVWILCVNCEALDYQSDLIGSLENLFSPFAHNPGQVRWPRVAYKILTFGIYILMVSCGTISKEAFKSIIIQ